MMEREWRTIPFATNYEVSNYGEIRNKKTDQVLKPHDTRKYYQIGLKCDNGKKRGFSIHRLVAQVFIPNPLNKPCVNHKDFNKTNNRVDNLEWVTWSENSLWSREHMGKARIGMKHSSESKQKMSKSHIATYNRPYPTHIYKRGKDKYMFLINRYRVCVVYKLFDTLEQAIKYKEKWTEEHKEVMEFA